MACARSPCGEGCGKRLARAIASPALSSWSLACRTALITVLIHRVNGLAGCWVAVMSITLSMLAGGAGPPVGWTETDRASASLSAG